MKVFVVILTILGVLVGQVAGAKITPEQEVLNISLEKFKYKTQGKFDQLAEVFDDSLEFVHITGHVSSKIEWMDELRSKRFVYVNIESKEASVKVTGDKAELKGKAIFKVLVHGSPGTYRLSFTENYVKKNGKWRLVGLYTNTY